MTVSLEQKAEIMNDDLYECDLEIKRLIKCMEDFKEDIKQFKNKKHITQTRRTRNTLYSHKRYDLNISPRLASLYKKECPSLLWDGIVKTWYWEGQLSKMPKFLKNVLKNVKKEKC